MKNLTRPKGVSLIIAVAIMLICSVLGVTMAKLLGVTSRASVDCLRSVQAFGLAQAGLNWYMMQLAGMPDWASAEDQTNITLGGGTFDVALSNKTATSLDFQVTGKIIGNDAAVIQRTMSQTAVKLPSAAQFAVYWGRDNGAWLELRSNTKVYGDIWSRGTTTVMSGSSVSGIVYRPGSEDVNGSGEYSEAAITPPYPLMPGINTAFYTNLINTYDALIDSVTGNTDKEQDTNLILNGNTLKYRNFNTDGNITISGNGIIVTSRSIGLHSRNGDSGTLTISPSGGNIIFIAGRDLTVNSTKSDTTVNGSSGIRMYSRSQSATSQMLDIRNSNTNISGALFLANRRILVESGAKLANCTLFVNYPGDDTNNYLRVTGSGTTVGTLANPCSLISVSPRDPGLIINNSASVAGLIYHKDTANTGYTQINSAVITGSLIANQYTNERITAATITYNPAAIPIPPPEGFDGFAAKKANSWNGN